MSERITEKSRYKKIVSLIFVILCVLSLGLFYSVIFRGQKNESIEENRTLQKVLRFSMSGFWKGEYQTKMEDSIGDQMAFSIEIKTGVKKFYNQLTGKTSGADKVFVNAKRDGGKQSEVLENQIAASEKNGGGYQTEVLENQSSSQVPVIPPQPDKNSYTYKEVVAGKVYKIDESGYLLAMHHEPEEYNFDLYDPEMLEEVTFPKYLFFIETSESTDFNDIQKSRAFEYIKQTFPMDGYDRLSFNSFDEYKNYFYQTDHHWNFIGSYTGYTKIMRLLEGEGVDVLRPSGRHTYHTVFNGSRSRDNLLGSATEEFTVFKFNLPEYKTFVNDVERAYGFRNRYVSDEEYPNKLYSNHYGLYYGDDRAKVVYDFNQPEKESILILGTSYTNAINELVASHYNQTHILDFRYYKEWYGEPINAQKYMEKNHLTKLLIIGDISSLGYLRKKGGQ
ncbi:MAG: hypothetical protein K6A43_09075 [Treponema sp.]|nr:hypothetical protein [Treponema sp.]